MDNINKFASMRRKLEEIEKRKDRLKGRLDGEDRKLKKLGLRNKKKARSELKRLAIMEKKIRAALKKATGELKNYAWDD